MGLVQPIATRRSATGIPTGKLAVWWLIGSEIVIFGGVLVSYIILRHYHADWTEEAAATNVWLGGLNTFVLLTSSLFAVLAHYYMEKRNDAKKASMYLWLTVVGALTFLVVKSFEWTHEIQHGYVMTKSLFWGFYYTAAGIHGLHVIAGAVIMGIIAIQIRQGKHYNRVELIGLYWHFVDIVWIFLFPLLYIAK
ncbi:MAG: cytochrome c oxidase subunit 3 [Bdellovibrionales bacterium]|nr:cytochrome c oxidase subunit 3 [Bdellovibrionales bacterium]